MVQGSVAYRYEEEYENGRNNRTAKMQSSKNKIVQQKTLKRKNSMIRRNRKRFLGILCAKGAVMVVLYGAMMIFLNVHSFNLNNEIITLKQDIEDMETQNKRLAYQIQEKSSLERVAEIARTQLGMVSPDMARAYLTEDILPVYVSAEAETEETENQTGMQKLYTITKQWGRKAFQTGMEWLAACSR